MTLDPMLLALVALTLVGLGVGVLVGRRSSEGADRARALQAEQRICMTGTPMENNLGDLWSLMAFANPGLLGTAKQFGAWYRGPIEREGDVDRFEALGRRIAPFVLRRTKSQVLAELPQT